MKGSDFTEQERQRISARRTNDIRNCKTEERIKWCLENYPNDMRLVSKRVLKIFETVQTDTDIPCVMPSNYVRSLQNLASPM